jgi:hypothetical protein
LLHLRLFSTTIFTLALIACAQPEAPVEPEVVAAVEAAATTAEETGGGSDTSFTEAEVEEYIRRFPYQETYDYAMRYTASDPALLNTWVVGAQPSLVKAGEDKIVRMNNDTFYKLAFVDLRNGPVFLAAESPDESRFVSFQLMDDRNVNYRNVIYPSGEFTLYHGGMSTDARGESIAVPSILSVVIVRVEVKDPGDSDDVAAAEDIFRTITIEGPVPDNFPVVDVLSGFSEAVASEANWRMDQAFGNKLPFRLTVVGPGQVLGETVPFLSHSAGTRGGWGGPGTAHSSYETINSDRQQDPLTGASGTYSVTTGSPPVDAFWSLTVYDSERGGFLHPNKHHRYHINNTMAVPNEDGTVTFLFKQDCMTTDVNCLEVPAGRFDIAARYYLPSEDIRSGKWELPPLELVSK